MSLNKYLRKKDLAVIFLMLVCFGLVAYLNLAEKPEVNGLTSESAKTLSPEISLNNETKTELEILNQEQKADSKLASPGPENELMGENIKVNFDPVDLHAVEETNPFFLSDPYGDEVRKTQSQDPDWKSTATHHFIVSDPDDDDFMSFWMYIRIPLSGHITDGVIHYSVFFNESDDNGNLYSDTWSGTKTITNSYDTMSELTLRFVHNTNTATFSIFRFEILNPDTGDWNNQHYKGETVTNGIAWVKMRLDYCYFTPIDRSIYSKIHYSYSGQSLIGTLDINNEYLFAVIQIIKPDYLTYQGVSPYSPVSNETNTVLLNCPKGNYEVYYYKNTKHIVPSYDWSSLFNLTKDCDSFDGWVSSGWSSESLASSFVHSGNYALNLTNNASDETFGLGEFPVDIMGSQDIQGFYESRVFFAYSIQNYTSGDLYFQYTNGSIIDVPLNFKNETISSTRNEVWHEVYLDCVSLYHPYYESGSNIFQFLSDNFNGTLLIDTFRIYGWTTDLFTPGYNVKMGEFRVMDLNGRNDPYLPNIRYDWYIKNWSSYYGINVTLDKSSNYSTVFLTDDDGYGRFYSYENLSAHYQNVQSSEALGLIITIENRNFTTYFNWYEPITWNDNSLAQLRDPIETEEYYVLDSKLRTTLFAVWLDDFFIGDQFMTGDYIYKNLTTGDHTLRICEWGDSKGWYWSGVGVYVEQYNFRLEVYRDYTYTIKPDYMVYFALINQFGIGLSYESLQVTVNDSRVFYPTQTYSHGTLIQVECLDFFEESLFQENYTITQNTQVNITINIWEVWFRNTQDYTAYLKVYKNNYEILGFENAIPPNTTLKVYMLDGSYEYEVFRDANNESSQQPGQDETGGSRVRIIRDTFQVSRTLPTVVDITPKTGGTKIDFGEYTSLFGAILGAIVGSVLSEIVKNFIIYPGIGRHIKSPVYEDYSNRKEDTVDILQKRYGR